MPSEEIGQRGIISLTDLIDATPGINVTGNNSGRNDRSFQQISLRGFTPSTTDSTLTATFIDGVPVSSASALNSITDPPRVEVLKGPQNAYFGRNAFAGAVNVVNQTPKSDFGGSMNASVFSRHGYDVQGSLEGPIARDILSFRISGRALERGGSYRNRANPNERLGDQSTRTVTGMLMFTPSSQLTMKVFGLYSEDNDGPAAQGMLSAYEVRSNNGVVNIPALSGNTNGTIIVPGLSNCTLNGVNPFICGQAPALPAAFSPARNTYIDARTAAVLADGLFRPVSPSDDVQGYGLKRKYLHAHANIDYELGDTGITLSSLTGVNDEKWSQMSELDNYDSSSLINTAATPTNGLLPYYNFPFAIERHNNDFSQELRASFDNGSMISGMIGLNYMDTKVKRDLFNAYGEAVLGLARGAGTASAPQRVETKGIFGSVNIKPTDALEISLEGRYQRDKVFGFTGGLGATISAAAAAENGVPAGTYAPLTQFFSKNYDNFMPRVIVNYKITPEIMAYASWSKAANVSISSFNARLFSGTAGEIAASQSLGLRGITVPEKLTNYEIGLKGRAFDNKLIFALSAYYGDWKNQYNTRSVFFVDNSLNPPLSSTVTGIANSGRTKVKGIELDTTILPMEGVSLTFSGAYNDTNIRSFNDPAITRVTGVTGDGFKGNSLPLTSKYSFAITPEFSGDIPGRDNATWFIRSDVNYKSRWPKRPGSIGRT
ncbi:TonB-dependent receptor, plug [Novosphingobium subterraneum]|uniref:TonB-dependent receptor, plug n=2 Tax=Novosphingobium subterraneum TaxID=48936 RepID=A0A0B9A384_9SPHN|nr:TonB-dependent receptor, plug [Novosphingobium subterraneum]